MDEEHIPTNSPIEDPPEETPEHQNGDDHIPAQVVVEFYTDGYMIEETCYENVGETDDNNDRTLTRDDRAQDAAEDLQEIREGFNSFLTYKYYFAGLLGFQHDKLMKFTTCNNKGFDGSAENDSTSKVYQKHEDEPISSSDIPGTSKECTPLARYPDDALTKKECDLHFSLDAQNAENETKPVCSSDNVLESPRVDDCEPGTSAIVKNMETQGCGIILRIKPKHQLEEATPTIGNEQRTNHSVTSNSNMATQREVSNSRRVFQGEDCDQGTRIDLHARKQTGFSDAMIPLDGKKHLMTLKLTQTTELTETTEQKTAEMNYPNVAMKRRNIGNRPALPRYQMLPATGETEDFSHRHDQDGNMFQKLSKKEEAYDTMDGSKLGNNCDVRALTNDLMPVEEIPDNSNINAEEHNGGENGSSEDIEILPLTVDVTVGENEVTDTKTITDDQTEETESMQETEQENVDNWTDKESLVPAESDKDQKTSEDFIITDITYCSEGQANEDSAIRDRDNGEQNVHYNQDDIVNPITQPTADIDFLDEPGDLDVERYHLNEIELHERPQIHAFVGADINDQDRAFNDQE